MVTKHSFLFLLKQLSLLTPFERLRRYCIRFTVVNTDQFKVQSVSAIRAKRNYQQLSNIIYNVFPKVQVYIIDGLLLIKPFHLHFIGLLLSIFRNLLKQAIHQMVTEIHTITVPFTCCPSNTWIIENMGLSTVVRKCYMPSN